jgi:outer membrane protein TolC
MGRVKSGVDAAHARENEAAARYRQAMLDANAELETSLTGYGKARERLAHLVDAAAASERATDLARLRFEEGGTDFIEVLDAERRQLEAQDRLAEGRSETSAWLVTVYRALGGSVPEALR